MHYNFQNLKYNIEKLVHILYLKTILAFCNTN